MSDLSTAPGVPSLESGEESEATEFAAALLIPAHLVPERAKQDLLGRPS